MIMRIKVDQGALPKVKIVEPSSLREMDRNAVIIVNRVRLNTKLVEFEIRNNKSSEAVVLKAVVRKMKDKETHLRRPAIGAEMSVGDIINVFPEYESLPKNTFALAER